MKIKHTLFAAALIAGLSSAASAEDIYVTGSTAFRASFVGAVVKLMGGSCQAKFEGASATGAARSVFVGTIGGVSSTVYCSWSGSVTGIQSLTSPGSTGDTFLSNTGTATLTQGGTYPAYTYTGGTANATGATPHNATLAMSDVFQGSTVHTTPTLAYDATVAVVPFKFVAGNGSPAAIGNMTPLLTQLLYGSGRVSQTLFTGSDADFTKRVYGLGRDAGSGTRLTVMAESGKGALNQVVQYSYNGTAFTNVGNGGSASGGGALATQLGLATNATTGYTIGYLGLTDAATAIGLGAKELTWNGVTYSAQAVYGGQYTLWGYEHLFASNTASAATITVADAIAAELVARPGTAGLELGQMKVQRSSEGGLIDIND